MKAFGWFKFLLIIIGLSVIIKSTSAHSEVNPAHSVSGFDVTATPHQQVNYSNNIFFRKVADSPLLLIDLEEYEEEDKLTFCRATLAADSYFLTYAKHRVAVNMQPYVQPANIISAPNSLQVLLGVFRI